VDKRKVRRDRADVFSTLAEGLKGKRAKDWGLIDDSFPTSKFQEAVDARVAQVVNLGDDVDASFPSSLWERGQGRGFYNANPSPFVRLPEGGEKNGIKLNPLEVKSTEDTREYKYVSLKLNREKRCADLTVHGPESDLPTTPDGIQNLGDEYWPLRAYRELDDMLLHLRVNEPEIGL